MKIQLSDHFTYKRLLRFTFPSMIMMILTSVYGVVDGFFVSNYVGKTQFAAVNVVMPFLMIFGAVGFMVGAGGSALVSMTLGTGNEKKAKEIFSLLIYLLIIVGAAFSIIGIICFKPVASFLGASEDMLSYCVTYGQILLITLVPFMLQNVFQSFLITAEKPLLGLVITACAGVTNMGLDALFMGVFKWGISGAAIATAISQSIDGLIPFIYFCVPNKSKLKLCKTHMDSKAVLKACTNGSSEFMTNVSVSLVSMLYNYRLINTAGENGVAAYGVIMYTAFIFLGAFMGYSIGTAPIIGYHYGAGNSKELKGLFGKSLRIIASLALILTLLAQIFSGTLAGLFVGYDKELFSLTVHAFRIYSLSFLLSGFNIFGSAFFTALNNGLISALISFARTLVFQTICVLVLPYIFGTNGIWLSVVAAEGAAVVLTSACLIKNRKKYNYA